MNINLRLKIVDLQRVQCCPAVQKCINIKNLRLKSFIYFVSKFLLANLIKQEKRKTNCYEIILFLLTACLITNIPVTIVSISSSYVIYWSVVSITENSASKIL